MAFGGATARKAPAVVAGFPSETPAPLCFAAAYSAAGQTGKPVFFRRIIIMNDTPRNARFYLFSTGVSSVFINGKPLPADSGTLLAKVTVWNITGKLRKNKNLVAIKVSAPAPVAGAVYPLFVLKLTKKT